jgi:small subunit ribosomal protein S16
LVRIRLQRHGRKKKPYYHIVAADVRSKRDGRIIEDLGRYDPVGAENKVSLKTERVIHWLKTGAQPTDTVRAILKKEGIMYRIHLMGWGKSAEEIETTLAAWHASKAKSNTVSSIQAKKDRLKAEEENYKKAQAEKAKAAAEKPKATEKVVVEVESAVAETESAEASVAEASSASEEQTDAPQA